MIGRFADAAFRLEAVKRAWFRLRRAVPPSPAVPRRTAGPYRTQIWGWGSPQHDTEIPRVIWTFWQGRPSRTVSACIESWRAHAQGWEVNVLGTKELAKYLPEFPDLNASLPPQKVSNLVRLMLLEKYGGVWLDASTLATTSLDWLRSEVMDSGCEAALFWNEHNGTYRKDLHRPIVENGCICAIPESPFIAHWREAYQDCIASEDYEDYFGRTGALDDLARNFVSKDNLSYFVCYLAAQDVMRTPDEFRLLLINAEDEFYYYYYHTKKPRNRRQFAETLLLCAKEACDQSRLIKITKGHRSLLDDHIQNGCFKDTSLLGQHLQPNNKSAETS